METLCFLRLIVVSELGSDPAFGVCSPSQLSRSDRCKSFRLEKLCEKSHKLWNANMYGIYEYAPVAGEATYAEVLRLEH